MIKVFEVTDQFPFDSQCENRKLWITLDKAEKDFNERINKYKKSLKLISESDYDEYKILSPIVYDIQKNKVDIYYYPPQFEIDDEPLWSDSLTIKIEEVELN